jgi:signal transduction histidine kinase
LSRILEVPPEKIVGADFRTFLPDSEREKIADRYLRRLSGGPVPQRYDLDILSATGKSKRAEMSVAIIQGIEGGQQVMGQIVDISDRLHAEQQRVELAVEKERVDLMRTFIGNITHDLKTPLTIIQTSLFLIERYTDSEKRQQKIEMIREQANLLNRLIQDLLMISQLDYLPELKWDAVDLNELVREVEKQLLAPVEKKRLDVQLQLASDIPPLSADREALSRAIINLFENAVNYTPEDHTIRVSTEHQDRRVILTVTDTGIGIDPEDMPYIFNRFYRSKKARQIVNSGSGLGLAIVWLVAEKHGGHVEVDSTPGVATTFRLFLPLETQETS